MTNTIANLAGNAPQCPRSECWEAPSLAEADMLELARAGDESAWEALVRQHGGHMLSLARRFLRTEEDCADAVQDAFLSAFRGLDGFEGNAALETWLHRIVVNVCLMKLRARSRARELQIDDLLPTFDESGHHSCLVRPWEDQAVSRLTAAETRAHVRACIDRLPISFGEILLLRDIEELTTQQTAQQLGINCGAVKTRLHRARQALRTLLEPVVLGNSL